MTSNYEQELETRCEQLEDAIDHARWSEDRAIEVLDRVIVELGKHVYEKLMDDDDLFAKDHEDSTEGRYIIREKKLEDAADSIANNILEYISNERSGHPTKRYYDQRYWEVFADHLTKRIAREL
jgi:hypothetical protein